MQRSSPESAGFSPESAPSKEQIVSQALEPDKEIEGRTLRELPGLLKWTLNINKSDEHYSKKVTETMIPGIVKGLVTERISHLVGREGAETVVPKEGELKSLFENSEIVSTKDSAIPSLGIKRRKEGGETQTTLEEGWLRGQKTGILQAATKATLTIPKGLLRKDIPSYTAEVVEGYGGSKPSSKKKTDHEGAQAGLYYEETVIPDAFIKSGEGEIVGAVEVKAYTPEEFSFYVEEIKKRGTLDFFVKDEVYNKALGTESHHYRGEIKLGFDIDGQQRMLDIIRDALYDVDRREELNPVLLRLLGDVADGDIEEFQLVCGQLGYQNMIVQKLPFTSGELDEIGKKAVEAVKEDFKESKKMQFGKRELEVISAYFGVEFD